MNVFAHTMTKMVLKTLNVKKEDPNNDIKIIKKVDKHC